MKDKIKACYRNLFGNESNIHIKLSITTLITAIVFSSLSFLCSDDPNAFIYKFLQFTAAIFFGIWINSLEKKDKVILNISRFLVYLIVFVWSLGFWANAIMGKTYHLFILWVILSIIGIFSGVHYFVIVTGEILASIKNVYLKLKNMLLNTREPAKGLKALIENITVFLISVGAFVAAILTIVKTVIELTKLIS